jgi:hypothetical protein
LSVAPEMVADRIGVDLQHFGDRLGANRVLVHAAKAA